MNIILHGLAYKNFNYLLSRFRIFSSAALQKIVDDKLYNADVILLILLRSISSKENSFIEGEIKFQSQRKSFMDEELKDIESHNIIF